MRGDPLDPQPPRRPATAHPDGARASARLRGVPRVGPASRQADGDRRVPPGPDRDARPLAPADPRERPGNRRAGDADSRDRCGAYDRTDRVARRGHGRTRRRRGAVTSGRAGLTRGPCAHSGARDSASVGRDGAGRKLRVVTAGRRVAPDRAERGRGAAQILAARAALAPQRFPVAPRPAAGPAPTRAEPRATPAAASENDSAGRSPTAAATPTPGAIAFGPRRGGQVRPRPSRAS